MSFPITTPDGHGLRGTYRIHNPLPGGDYTHGPNCGATRIRTCVPLGDGITKVITHDTFNSDPSLALFQTAVAVSSASPASTAPPTWTS
ncbi:hypothetical protein GCM10027563_33670 [Parasphingorhabdus pacifica]